MNSKIFGKNTNTLWKQSSGVLFPRRDCHVALSHHRWISSTSQLQSSWISKIKGFFTGNKGTPEFTLNEFADQVNKSRPTGSFKQSMVGGSGGANYSDSFEKHEAIIRFLATIDATGENLQSSDKQEAMKKCNCSIIDVENALSKFIWAKAAHKKVDELQKEGKPIPKNFSEVQKIMGISPVDIAKSNLAKGGHVSRNAFCPCGSKKRYKRCCGK